MANQIAAAIRRSPRSQRFYASALGLSPQAMNDRMRGRTRWSLADAIILSRLLGKTVDELVGDEDLPTVGYTIAEETTAS